MDPVIRDLIDHARDITVAGLLGFVLYGGWRRWWVWGWAYKDVLERLATLERDRDEWKFMAMTGTRTAHTAVSLAEKSGS